jgi:hypothetical protein
LQPPDTFKFYIFDLRNVKDNHNPVLAGSHFDYPENLPQSMRWCMYQDRLISSQDCSAEDCSAEDCSAEDCSAEDCSAEDCRAFSGIL